MQPERSRDPVYIASALLLAACAVAFFLINPLLDDDLLRIRPVTAVLSLLVALGLFFRVRRGMRAWTIVIGAVVMLLCGAQLAMFVIVGKLGTADAQAISQNFAAGLFGVGTALVIDGVLPPRWGRHLVLGLIGAIVAGIGLLGLFGLLASGIDVARESALQSMRLPSGLILVFSGIALLAGARLRKDPLAGAFTTDSDGDELRDRTGLAAGLVMLLATLGATGLIWREAINYAQEQKDLATAQSMERLAAALAANALDSVGLLNGLRGLFSASVDVTGEEWSRYLANIRLGERFVGVIAVVHVAAIRSPLVAADGSLEHIVDGERVKIWPPGKRDGYFPLMRITPDTPVTRRMLGFDAGSDAQHRATLEDAAANGVAAMSGRIGFAQYNDPQSRSGFVIVKPVPAGSDGNPGFVYTAVDIGTVIDKAAADSGIAALRIELVDMDSQPASEPLFRSPDFDTTKDFLSLAIDVAGRTWSVHAQPRAQAMEADARVPGLIFAGGSLCALILFAITWVLAGHRARALHLAATMTSELRKSQRAQQAITDTANAGIITADSGGDILYVNPCAATMFGVAAASLAGQSITVLIPERLRAAHLAGLARVASGELARAGGQTLEMTALRSDGSEFPIEILLSAWTSDGQMFFTAFMRDITQRQAAQTMLIQKTRELERSNADLEQFAYVASHDLQEPLRMVASYVQLLARRYRGKLDGDADEFIGFAVDGATRMQRLIQDLLAYARVGRSGQVPTATHVAQCAQAAVAQLQEVILESDARVRINVDCVVKAVPSLLTQVFQNLIANALKFRDQTVPEIHIDAALEGDFWHIQVRDNGIGIEPQHRERVFAIFQRLHTRREYPGTGIGLAICRRIIEGVGGRIWVESEPGQGSVFHFTVPAVVERA